MMMMNRETHRDRDRDRDRDRQTERDRETMYVPTYIIRINCMQCINK